MGVIKGDSVTSTVLGHGRGVCLDYAGAAGNYDGCDQIEVGVRDSGHTGGDNGSDILMYNQANTEQNNESNSQHSQHSQSHGEANSANSANSEASNKNNKEANVVLIGGGDANFDLSFA